MTAVGASQRSRVAVIATHPIQYYAPLFQLLHARGQVELRVFYGHEGPGVRPTHDPDFGQAVQWDVPLLDGYDYTFVPNESTSPGPHAFRGIASGELVPRVRAWRPDVLLIYGWSYQSHLAALRAFHSRVPILFRGDSTLLDERPGPRAIARRIFLTWIYRHIDIALYVGQNNHRYFRKHGVRSSALVWVPHAIDNERFRDGNGALEGEAREWRRSIGIGDRDVAFVFAGKLEDKKAPDSLLSCFLRRGRKNEHLIVVGNGPLDATLRSMAGTNDRVHFLGFQNQTRMPLVYRLGEAFVLPSRGPGETWGLAVNEAMASRRPAIVSDRVGCAPDLVIESETGAVFSHDKAGSLDAALTRVAGSNATSQRLGERACRHIQRWSLEEQALRIEQAVALASDERAVARNRQEEAPPAAATQPGEAVLGNGGD